MKLKNLLLISTLGLLNISLAAQLEYQTTHNNDLKSFIMDNGEMKYASYHKADETMVLYNSDHSEWKSVKLNIPRNHYFDELKLLSAFVFNTDEQIELAYTCKEYISNNDTESTTEYVEVEHSLYIINEEGNLILEAENSNHMEIVDNSGSRKLWLYKQAGADNSKKVYVDVYTLPDAPLSDLKIKQSDKKAYSAYGDPIGF